MPQMTPEQASTVLHAVVLPTLETEYPVTASVIAAIPAGAADYRPDAVSKSAIELAWHLVTAECRFLQAVLAGAFDLAPWERPAAVRAGPDVNAWYAERLPSLIERLGALDGAALTRTIDFRGLFQLPAIAYANLAIRHTIHHRGQLTMYLRPTGAKVPSIYGESYDARVAREQRSSGA